MLQETIEVIKPPRLQMSLLDIKIGLIFQGFIKLLTWACLKCSTVCNYRQRVFLHFSPLLMIDRKWRLVPVTPEDSWSTQILPFKMPIIRICWRFVWVRPLSYSPPLHFSFPCVHLQCRHFESVGSFQFRCFSFFLYTNRASTRFVFQFYSSPPIAKWDNGWFSLLLTLIFKMWGYILMVYHLIKQKKKNSDFDNKCA